MMPWLGLVLAVLGSAYPGWVCLLLGLGVFLLGAGVLGCSAHLLWSQLIASAFAAAWKRLLQRTLAFAGIAIVLVLFRPTLYLAFWISKPSLDRAARQVLQMPFNGAGAGGGWEGAFCHDGIRRCPHGIHVQFRLPVPNHTVWANVRVTGELFYRDAPGDCQYVRSARHLGGGWYLVQ